MSPAMIHSPASPGPVDPLDEDSETAAPADERAEEEDDATEEEEEEAEEDEDEEEEEQEEEEEAGTTRLAEGYYEIETIRRRRIHKGKLQYLIKWCGWPESTNTWEPYENLTACKDIVDAFEKRRKRKRMTLSSQGTSANPSHGKRALSSQGTSANPSHGKRGHPRRSDPRSLIRCPALEPKKLPLRSSSKRITNNSKKNSVARGLEALVNVVEQQIIGEMETQECGSCVVSAVCPYQGTPLSVEVNQPDDHGKSNGVSKAGNSKQAPPSQGGPMTRAKKRKCESVKRFIQNEATQEQGELQICRIEKPGHEDVDSTGGSGDRTKACTLYISFPPRPADEAVDGMEPIPAKPKKDAKEGGAPETGCKWKKKPQAPPQMKPPKKTEVSTAGASHVGTSAIDVSAAVNSATAASTPASSAPDVEAHEMEREQAPNPAREAEDKAATETPVVVTSSGDLFSALAEQALAAARVTHEAEGTPFPNAEMGSGCSPPSSYESREAWGRLAELVPWGSIELPQVVERGQVAIEAINAFVAAMPADLASLLNLATEARTRAKAPLPETDPVLVAKDVEIAKLREELADQQERVKEAQAAQAAAELKVKDNAAQAAELDKLIKEARRLESEAVDFQEKIEATKQELERERKSNKVLRTNFDHLTKSKRTAKDRIRKLNLDVKDLERRLVASENAVTGLRAAAVVALGTMGASPLPALENTEGIISSLQTVSALRSATEGQAMLQAAKEAFVRVRLCFTLPLVEIAQRDPDEHDEEDVVEAKKLAEEPAEIIAALTASVLAGKGQ